MIRSRRNIYLLYGIQSLISFEVFIPVMTLFFLERGLTLFQIMLLQSIFAISMIIMEIPSGYFADRLGRKASIVVSIILMAFGFLLYYASFNFWMFVLSEIIIGLGASFLSGSDSALLYDSLIETNNKEMFKKYEGKRGSLSLVSESIASVLGGFIAKISLSLPLLVQFFITLAALPFGILLKETKIHMEKRRSFVKDIKTIINYSKNKKIKWFFLLNAFILNSTLVMFWFIQPLLKQVGLDIKYFGFVMAALLLISAYFSYLGERYEKALGINKALLSLVILAPLGYGLIILFNSIYGIVFLALFYIVRGLAKPILSDYINKMIDSKVRATLISINNLISRVIFSIVSPFIGLIADKYSLNIALGFSGLLFLVGGLIALARLGD